MNVKILFPLIIIALFHPVFHLYAQKKTSALVITPLTTDFYIFTTWQTYGGEPFPSNGMYVITDAGAVIIDCPWDSTQFQPLLDSIRIKHEKKVAMVIATHYHNDRTGGFEYYGKLGIPTWSSADTKVLCMQNSENQSKQVFRNDTVFRIGNTALQTYYPGKGHTADNIVIWFGKEKILYGGCFIKSKEADGLGNLSDADITAWPASVKKVISRFKEPRYVIPGHQNWDDPQSPEHTLQLLEKHINNNRLASLIK